MWTMILVVVAFWAGYWAVMSDVNSWKFDALCEVSTCALVAAGACWLYGV